MLASPATSASECARYGVVRQQPAGFAISLSGEWSVCFWPAGRALLPLPGPRSSSRFHRPGLGNPQASQACSPKICTVKSCGKPSRPSSAGAGQSERGCLLISSHAAGVASPPWSCPAPTGISRGPPCQYAASSKPPSHFRQGTTNSVTGARSHQAVFGFECLRVRFFNCARGGGSRLPGGCRRC